MTNSNIDNMTESLTITVNKNAEFRMLPGFLNALDFTDTEIDFQGILLHMTGEVRYSKERKDMIHNIIDNSTTVKTGAVTVEFHETEDDEIEVSDYSKDIITEYRGLARELRTVTGVGDDGYELSTQSIVEMLLNIGLTAFRNSVEDCKNRKEKQ